METKPYQEVNNFDACFKLLNFESDLCCYRVQLMTRKKDFPEGVGKNSNTIREYYITNKTDLNKIKESIIKNCKAHCARAYFQVNKRNLETVALDNIELLANIIKDRRFDNSLNAYSKAFGNSKIYGDKYWVIDLDDDQINLSDSIIEYINTVGKINNNAKTIVGKFPTYAGFHILTQTFPIKINDKKNQINYDFTSAFKGVELHKDNMLILYAYREHVF